MACRIGAAFLLLGRKQWESADGVEAEEGVKHEEWHSPFSRWLLQALADLHMRSRNAGLTFPDRGIPHGKASRFC